MFIFKKIASFFQRQPKKILTDSGLIYILNEKEKTAILERDKTAVGDIVIPRSIIYNSEEFIITEILENSFNGSINIYSISFQENSEITKIGEGAFFHSSIHSISLPLKLIEIPSFLISCCFNLQSVEIPENSELRIIDKNAFCKCTITSLFVPSKAELQPGWCYETRNLNKITISPLNHRYSEYKGQFILGKTDENSDSFDTLLFANRNIQFAQIPSFINKISDCAFDYCQKLNQIEFSSSSEMIIEENAFSNSSLPSISIPPFVTLIGKSAFFACKKLRKVNFEGQSKLNAINDFAFAYSNIESIFVPSSVITIGKSAFECCLCIQKIEFCEDSNLELIDNDAFYQTPITSIIIPPRVKEIGFEAFSKCDKLQIIEISESSQLGSFKASLSCSFQVVIVAPRNVNIIFS